MSFLQVKKRSADLILPCHFDVRRNPLLNTKVWDFSSDVVERTAPSELSYHYYMRLRNRVATLNGNQKRLIFTSLFIIFFLFFTFSSFSQSVKRVVSLAPSITENIYLIGAEKRLVGCTSYCTQAVADGVQQVGSTVEVNIEKILTLRPELVITMMMTKPQDVETLRKLGIRVEVMPSPKNFSEICEQTLLIAKWLGHENTAKQVVNNAKHIVDSLKQLSIQKPKKADVFFQLGASPVFTVLDNTFMNDYILMCHGENIFKGLNKGIVTRESVLLKNPEVIIIATMGGYGENEQKVWQSYKGLKAAENKRIFLIDSETACSPTPANFVRALTDVYQFVNQ